MHGDDDAVKGGAVRAVGVSPEGGEGRSSQLHERDKRWGMLFSLPAESAVVASRWLCWDGEKEDEKGHLDTVLRNPH